jgi:endoglucanase
MNRRDFIKTSAAATALGVSRLGLGAESTGRATPPRKDAQPKEHAVNATSIPRWRGFNLQEMFGWGRRPGPFSELDFELMAQWGFNFARLPMSYWNWSDPKDWMTINDEPLKNVDQAIALGKQYGIHINLNFHRIPGYCVSRPEDEPMQLFQGPREDRREALRVAVHHWKHFARRYKGIPSERLSFDLLNEPPYASLGVDLTRLIKAQLPEFAPFLITEQDYVDVVRALVQGIREIDPDRLIFADGVDFGRSPVQGVADLGIVQSARGYDPMSLTHYKASWASAGSPWLTNTTVPTWPITVTSHHFANNLIGMVMGYGRWDRKRLITEQLEPWGKLEAKGVRVHVGECGVYNRTPHDVALAWMRDVLALWKGRNWGYALWELRGGFGVLDSNRSDVTYEALRGHKLDRKMLALLQEH